MILIQQYGEIEYFATSLTHDHLLSLVGYEVDKQAITLFFPKQRMDAEGNSLEPHPTHWIAEPSALTQIDEYCKQHGHTLYQVTLNPFKPRADSKEGDNSGETFH